jgi:hypothetical protein
MRSGPNKITAADTGGSRQLAMRTRWTARAAESQRSAKVRREIKAALLKWSLFAAAVCLLAGCSSAPNLTAEDRRGDIRFLAEWAKEYSPNRVYRLPGTGRQLRLS